MPLPMPTLTPLLAPGADSRSASTREAEWRPARVPPSFAPAKAAGRAAVGAAQFSQVFVGITVVCSQLSGALWQL